MLPGDATAPWEQPGPLHCCSCPPGLLQHCQSQPGSSRDGLEALAHVLLAQKCPCEGQGCCSPLGRWHEQLRAVQDLAHPTRFRRGTSTLGAQLCWRAAVGKGGRARVLTVSCGPEGARIHSRADQGSVCFESLPACSQLFLKAPRSISQN